MKNKGVLKCASLVLCLVCLLHCFVFPVACLDYSANPPSYINYRCFYIEVNTSQLGRGTIILPDNYKWDDISTYNNSTQLINKTSGTLTGRFVTQGGTTYSFRFSAFNTPQYQTTSNGISTWTALTVTQLYTTNGSIDGNNGIKVYNVADSDKIFITILIIGVFFMVLFNSLIFILNRRRGD